MANPRLAVLENVPGHFFVDSTCIDCDVCRQLAPRTFAAAAEHSYVWHQPQSEVDTRAALQALVACPTGSIGAAAGSSAKRVLDDFPLWIDDNVYLCGFTSPRSYGGHSYFVRNPSGNWLVDSPKFLPRLARRFEQLGGIAFIFLTHRDDVADAEKYAQHFGAERIIHARELRAQPTAEVVIDGIDPRPLTPDFLAIPTPGHTAGHMTLLYQGRYLFSGDHLWWDRDAGQLDASHHYCWYSWPRQIDSMAELLKFDFEWVLPGHGQRAELPAERMHHELLELVERMRATTLAGIRE